MYNVAWEGDWLITLTLLKSWIWQPIRFRVHSYRYLIKRYGHSFYRFIRSNQVNLILIYVWINNSRTNQKCTYWPLAHPVSMLIDPQISIPRPRPIVLIIGITVILPETHKNRYHNKSNPKSYEIYGVAQTSDHPSMVSSWTIQNEQSFNDCCSITCDPVQQNGHLVGQVYSEKMSKTVCKI